MKILVISANHPPYHLGGYGLRIHAIMDGLASKGHEVVVLTTRAGKKRQPDRDPFTYLIDRSLHDRYNAKWFPKELLFDLLDIKILEDTIQEFNPHVIYLGHIYPFTKQLLPFLSTLKIPIVFDEGGNNTKGAWTDHGRWFRFVNEYQSPIFIMNKVKPFIIKFVEKISQSRMSEKWLWPKNMKIIFNSELNRENALYHDVPVEDSLVIHSGLDTRKFSFEPREGLSSPLKLIIPGRIEEKKGQIDGIRLIYALKLRGIEAELTLAGSPSEQSYYEKIKREIQKLQLRDKVTFLPMVDQEVLSDLYRQSDICLFSSYHNSGFSRVPLEAMASGCLVISYGNEGSNELIEDGRNGFIIDPENIPNTIDLINSLIEAPVNYQKITTNAREEVEKKYSLEKYVDEVEGVIRSIVVGT